MIQVLHYLTETGRGVFADWLVALPDARVKARIAVRIGRFAVGNFGDCKRLHGGVSELRINLGPGYRVCYAMLGRACVLLLCGGDKRKQATDIDRAITHLLDYRRRVRST